MVEIYDDAEYVKRKSLLELARTQLVPALEKLKLTKDERKIISELKKGQIKVDDEEKIRKIKKLLKKRGEALKKTIKEEKLEKKVEDTIKRFQKLRKIIRDEKELFDIFEKKYGIIRPKLKKYMFEFEVKPIEKGDDLSVVEVELRILDKLAKEEKDLYYKISSGEVLTDKEIAKVPELMRKMHVMGLRDLPTYNEELIKFLANFLSPPKDKEKALKFWRRAPIAFKNLSFLLTLNALGLIGEEWENLFRYNPDVGIRGATESIAGFGLASR